MRTSKDAFSIATRRAAYERSGGRCEWQWSGARCPQELTDGNVEYHHRKDVFWGGDNSLENCAAICRACHKVLTRSDAGRKAKTRTKSDRAKGIRPRKRRMGYTRFDGTVVYPRYE